MKVGVRKPSVSRRVKARTTGRVKRSVKKAVIPYYGVKGTGIIKDPKKAVYNKIYSKTTIGVDDIVAAGIAASDNKKKKQNNAAGNTNHAPKKHPKGKLKTLGVVFRALSIFFFLILLIGLLAEVYSLSALGLISCVFTWVYSDKCRYEPFETIENNHNCETDMADFNLDNETEPEIQIDVDMINDKESME